MNSSPSPPYSAWVADAWPSTWRANSITACWKPAQVPRNGTPRSRAQRMPDRAPSRLRYGLPGAHQTPAAPAISSGPRASSASVATQRTSGGATPRARAACPTAGSIDSWAANCGNRSPTTAMKLLRVSTGVRG